MCNMLNEATYEIGHLCVSDTSRTGNTLTFDVDQTLKLRSDSDVEIIALVLMQFSNTSDYCSVFCVI